MRRNLFSNGTMDTAGGWKGDGKMVKDEPAKGEAAKEADKEPANRFLLLSAKKNGPVEFRQEIDFSFTLVQGEGEMAFDNISAQAAL